MKSIIFCLLLIVLTSSQEISCTESQVYVKFTKKTFNYANEESWEVYSGTQKIYTSPSLANNAERVIEQCFPVSTNNQYTIKMKDSYGDSWVAGAYLKIEGIYGNTIFKHVITASREEELPLSLYYPVMKNAVWKLTSGSVTGTWTEYNYSDASWSEVTLGAVTVPTSGTQYFRKQFVSVAGMAAYEASFNYRFGIVAYINGLEIYRDNMPDGTPTSTTAATGSYPGLLFHPIVRSGLEVNNPQSVLAVEIHFTESTPQTIVDFNAYLALYAKTVTGDDVCYAYPHSVTATASKGSYANYLVDWTKNTRYEVSYQLTGAVTLTFTPGGPKAYINGLRLWPYTLNTYMPATYTVQGNIGGGRDWFDILQANELLYFSQTYSNTITYFNGGVYDSYRMQFTKGGSWNYIYDAYLMVCNIPLPSSIAFAKQTYTYYAKYEQIEIRPNIHEFTDCTISPAPGEGLEFDETKCMLTGQVDTAGSTVYTISSTMNGQVYTGSFTLQITECAGTVISATRTYKTNAAAEAFTIKDAATQSVVLEVAANAGQENNVETHYVLCLTGSKYTVSVDSSSYEYWQPNSYLFINALLDGNTDYETITKVRFDDRVGRPATHTFNAQYAIKPNESWYYKMGEVPANWYNSETSGWSNASAGSYPASTNQIQLYKKTFTVSSLDDVAGLVISLKYQYGVAIYLNNHEVFRKGFTGDLSTSTYSSTSLSNVNFRQISLPIKSMGDGTTTPISYVTTGTNTIAIALIAAGPAQTASNFDCAIRLMCTGSMSRVGKTSLSYNYTNGNPAQVIEYSYSGSMQYNTCQANYYQITFDDDRHEWISSFIIKLAYNQNTKQPRDVILKAKNAEDSEWTTLITVTGMNWSLTGQANRVWLHNNKSYNQYRFERFATGSTTDCAWMVGALDLRSDATQIDVPALSYPASTSIFRDIEMGEIYPNSDYYTDFSVTPTLPTGVLIDPYSGVISGTCHDIISPTTYTISAKKFNSGETVTAQMSLAVEICTGGKSLITLVARADSAPTQSSWKLFQGKGTSGTVIQSLDALPLASNLNYGDFCIEHGIYTLELKDTSTGWTNPAGYYLTVDVGEMKFEMGQVTGTAPATVTTMFSSYLPFQIEYDDWKVYKGSDVDSAWKDINFDDSTWTTTKAAQIGTNDAITTYIRREVTIPDIADYHVLNVRVKYSGGVVAYFNGRKVARFNLDESFDKETESIEIHDPTEFSMFHIVLTTVGAVTGKNIMAFEIHRPVGQSSSEAVVFDATGVFGVNDCSIGVDSVVNISGDDANFDNLADFFDLTPVTYGYQPNAVGTYLQWSVENLEGTKFNSFALQTVYARSSWGFSLYGRDKESLNPDDPDAEEYITIYEGVNQSTQALKRVAWSAPVGIAGLRQFRHEVDDAANNKVYISAYIFQYCKASGTGICPGIGDYPPVAEGEISPAECDDGYRGYSYRICTNGVLGEIKTDKCQYREPARMRYDNERMIVVMNTQVTIAAPNYVNIINKFYLEENTYLPQGLSLDETTGVISGMATEESGLKSYTIYGENPAGVTFTVFNLSVRKGECRADGNFPKTSVGEVAEYDCAIGGSFVGTQKRACILGAEDGEWQQIQGVCFPIFVIVIIVVVVIVIIAVVVLIIIRATKKTKAVGGVKGRASSKSTSQKKLEKKASNKTVKV